MRHLSQRARCTGGYQHSVSPQPQRHMGVPSTVTLREKVADNGMLAQRGKGDGRDKLFAGRGYDHLYLCAFLNQATDDEARLIGRNASRNAQNNMLSL